MRRNLIDSILQTVPKCQSDEPSPSVSRSPPITTITPTRGLSRTNSNFSTTSSGNRGDLSSTLSTTSVASTNKSQIAKSQLDYKQLIAKVSTSGYCSPIRSFQRATISSAVKTRIYDNNPQLLKYQPATVEDNSGPQSLNTDYSHSSSPITTTTNQFSRSRSFRMSASYQKSPAYRGKNSRTPEHFSFNSSETSMLNESQAFVRLLEENRELRENIEFLECELAVMNENLKNERNKYKKDLDDLMAAKVKAESSLLHKDIEINGIRLQLQRAQDELADKARKKVAQKESSEAKPIIDLTESTEDISFMLIDKLKL